MFVRRTLVAAVCLAAALLPAGAFAGATGRAANTATVYSVRVDPRMCPSPMCGGFWAGRVNWKLTPCLTGVARAACYAATVDLSALTAPARLRAQPALPSGRALVEGAFAHYGSTFPQLAKLVAARVWLSVGAQQEAGTIYRVIDTGLRCIRAPCFSLRATVVNGTRSVTLSALDLAGSGATPATISRAHALLARGGVLVSGTVRTLAGTRIADPGRAFAATRLWLPA